MMAIAVSLFISGTQLRVTSPPISIDLSSTYGTGARRYQTLADYPLGDQGVYS